PRGWKRTCQLRTQAGSRLFSAEASRGSVCVRAASRQDPGERDRLSTRILPAMRTVFVMIASAAFLMTSCKSGDKPRDTNAPVERTSTAAIALAIGGQLVDVGTNKVEVRVFTDGRAEALVIDGHGSAIAAPEKAKVTLHAKEKGAPDARTAI